MDRSSSSSRDILSIDGLPTTHADSYPEDHTALLDRSLQNLSMDNHKNHAALLDECHPAFQRII